MMLEIKGQIAALAVASCWALLLFTAVGEPSVARWCENAWLDVRFLWLLNIGDLRFKCRIFFGELRYRCGVRFHRLRFFFLMLRFRLRMFLTKLGFQFVLIPLNLLDDLCGLAIRHATDKVSDKRSDGGNVFDGGHSNLSLPNSVIRPYSITLLGGVT